jgi:archaellum component FlaG (FlaF/FlaG flagellin family)
MRLIQVTHNGHPLLVNPEHIVMVERNGDGTATLYLSNREYKKVAQTVEEVQVLANGTPVEGVLLETAPTGNSAESTQQTEDDNTEGGKSEHPARNRQTKPVTPPETK